MNYININTTKELINWLKKNKIIENFIKIKELSVYNYNFCFYNSKVEPIYELHVINFSIILKTNNKYC